MDLSSWVPHLVDLSLWVLHIVAQCFMSPTSGNPTLRLSLNSYLILWEYDLRLFICHSDISFFIHPYISYIFSTFFRGKSGDTRGWVKFLFPTIISYTGAGLPWHTLRAIQRGSWHSRQWCGLTLYVLFLTRSHIFGLMLTRFPIFRFIISSLTFYFIFIFVFFISSHHECWVYDILNFCASSSFLVVLI